VSLAGVLTALAVQTFKGWHEYEIGRYFAWYLAPNLVDVALLAVLAIFVQALAPNKFAGWAIMVVYYILTAVAAANLGLDHKLYLYGDTTSVPLSEMNGQGRFGVYSAWFRAYWSAFAILLLVIAYGLWRRGTETRLKPRLRRLPRRLVGAPGVIAALALVVFADWAPGSSSTPTSGTPTAPRGPGTASAPTTSATCGPTASCRYPTWWR
jgi:hypothetical protein